MQEGTNSLRKLRRDWWKTKLCTACVSPLGRFLSRGGICPQCGLRVCKNCRSELESGAWVCVLCSNGMPSDDLAKTTKSLGRDSRSIRRSWTISNPQQRAQTNSPILKSYTVLYPEDGEVTDGIASGECSVSAGHLSTEDNTCGNNGASNLHFFGGSDQGINSSNKSANSGSISHKKNANNGGSSRNDEVVNGLSTTRQFHSLPRMSSASGGLTLFVPSSTSSPSAAARALGLPNRVGKRSVNSDFDKENIKRHRSFQTTLHPYTPSQANPPSPAASINFIEETFWDYYDYEIENSSSDPSSTPRNPRKIPGTTTTVPTEIKSPRLKLRPSDTKRTIEGSTKPSTLVTFRTDSNRSSCERSLGETMDYDCSLRTNQFSSLSDTEINETGKDPRKSGASPYSVNSTGYRRHSNVETNPRSTYHYATISSTTNPYLPASEYVYRRRHDEMMTEAPPKPERKYRNSKRSVSLNAYDGRRLFSPLRTYCVLMKENIEPGDKRENENDNHVNFTTLTPLNNPRHESSATKSKSNLESGAAAASSSAIHKSSASPISLSFSTISSSPHKFNSLPRERYIRIEREDGNGSMNAEKYSSLKYPSKKSEVLLGKSRDIQHQQQQISSSSREKNVTRVPIVQDDDNDQQQRFSSIRNFSTGPIPPKNKIERSQSYKEISSSSSRPYPYYHQYHPHPANNMEPQNIQFTTNNNNTAENIRHRHNHHHPDKSSSTADLNYMPTGTATLPNFRNRGSSSKGQFVSSSSASVWNDKKDQTTSSGSRKPNNFFQSDFGDDESDVVIENFIKTHSSTNNASNSNTLPKRKYPPSSTHISNTPQRDNDSHRSYGERDSSMKSDLKATFQQDSLGDNYLRQCSTFPRGGVRTRASKSSENVDDNNTSTTKQTENLPNYNKSRNSSFDFPKGYSNVEKIDVFFHPSPSTGSAAPFDVPKQSHQLPERVVPIKLAAGPGSSATLPHPYIRRNKQMTVAPPLEKPSENNPTTTTAPNIITPTKSPDSGPSISEVEMEIERDIFYQKTRSLDRIRPSSKSKLKSVLSIGRSSSNANAADRVDAANAHQHYPMEIDYSDSQPYNKGRHHESLFSIDQVDRKYANSSKSIHATGTSTSSDQHLLEPQQIHHSHSVSAPIPSPRLKRKGKLQPTPSFESATTSALCSPKINGDEMSSTSKLVGPGTNNGFGSKKQPFTSSSSGRLTEPDIRNDLDILRKTNGAASSSTNPISLGNPSLNATSSTLPTSKLSLVKETSIHADNHHQHHHHQTASIGMSNGDGNNKSEKSSVTNYISQPSTPASVTPNYSNVDGPGVNFMISNSMSSSSSSPQFDSQPQQHQSPPFASAPKYFSETKTKAAPDSQKKSALATADASSKLNKAVRFEPHVIKMEMELEHRKLLQQQQQINQLSGLSAQSSPSTATAQLVNSNVNNPSGNANGPKSGTHIHRHGHGTSHNGNKARAHHVHAYLPVLYHQSYHQQQHKYRKGATVGGKNKKIKGFVARAIAKVKGKKAVDSSTTVGKQDKGNSSSSTSNEEFLQYYAPSSSVITYISPQPQAHHQQPPVQQSLEESKSTALQENSPHQYPKPVVPSITVSLTSATEEVAESAPVSGEVNTSSRGILVKTKSESVEHANNSKKPIAKYVITPGGRLKKNLHKGANNNNKASLSSPKPSGGATRRMDAYLTENMDEGQLSFGPSESDERHPQGLPIPSSFTLQTDQISSSSTSSTSSSFTSNLQESYELFHNQTLPDRIHQLVSEVEAAATEDNERCDSLDEDEDSDNNNIIGIDDIDGPSTFKSFDESDFDEDEDADFVFYPTPRSTKPPHNQSSSSAKHNIIDTDHPHHHHQLNKAITSSIVTSSTDLGSSYSYAPFGSNINETTTKGNVNNHQYSDSTSDSRAHNAMKKGKSNSEPKMVVGIPTYRSPNSRRPLINSHHGKSQASIPNANPTVSSAAKENVKHKFKEPHPTQQLGANETINVQNNAISAEEHGGAAASSMYKDSSRVGGGIKQQQQSEDVSHDHERKGLLSRHHNHAQQAGKTLQQHHKNQNQVDEKSHPQPLNDKRNSKRIRAYEKNVDVHDDHHVHDEDTLQKDAKNTSTTTTTMNVPTAAAAESCRNERVENDTNPHDATGFLKISTTEKNSTEYGATGAHNNSNRTQQSIPSFGKRNSSDHDEGRLTDLTSTITRSTTTTANTTNNGQQLAVLDQKLEDLKDAPESYIVDGGEQKEYEGKEVCELNSSGESSLPSWAKTKNHNSVTTSNKNCQHQKDKERLARLELVVKKVQTSSADFEIPRNIDNEVDSGPSSSPPQLFEQQPNSLETHCGNDQSFLSESEVSSGKSPSPSPRFKSRNKRGNGSGAKLIPKFKTGAKVAGGSRGCDTGSEEEVESNSKSKPSHLLNAHTTQSCFGRQRETTGEEIEEYPLFSPDSGPFGMSMLPPQQHPAAASSTSVSDANNFIGKFKSRVLLNSDDLEDDEEIAQHVADTIHNNKVNNRTTPAKRNITTVEISGDVGIVSSGGGGGDDTHQNVVNSSGGVGGSSSPPNSAPSISGRQAPLLSNDHLQSSGLSLISQPTSINLHDSSSDEDSLQVEKPIEPQIRTKLVNNDDEDNLIGIEELEVGSSVSANESSGDNDTEKTTTSDDNSSDWQSESTNTVIFRGNPSVKKNSDTDIDPCNQPPSLYGHNSYLDPEIQINNITIGGSDYDDYHPDDDDDHTGNDDVTPNPTPEPPSNSNSNNSSSKSVNVGYKATKVNKVSTDLIIGIKKSSADNVESGSAQVNNSNNTNVKVGSKRKFDKNNDVSSSSSSSSSNSSNVDSSEELGKSNETLTDINEATIQDHVVHRQVPDSNQEHLEMVMQSDKQGTRLYVPNNSNKSPHQRRESPEGQEQEVPDQSEKDKSPTNKPPISEKPRPKSADATDMKMEEGDNGEGKPKKNVKSTSSTKGSISKERIVQSVLSQIPSRSSPDGADADRDATPEPEVESPTPPGVIDSFDVTSDEDSWVEEILFEDEDDTSFEEAVKKLPPPLDLTLHTIVEESCEESEAENSGNFYQPSTSGIGGSQKNHSLSQSDSNANELEKYFNFGIYTDHNSSAKNSLPNEESEFSDTFSESSFSLQEEDFDNGTEGLLDPAELASTRLEKYFYNLGVPQSMMNPMGGSMNQHHHHADSDSVGSESDSDNSVLEKRKKVLKHHRRSADFEEEFGDKVSDEEDSFVFGQDGFDTIKKTARKTKKSGSEGSISNDSTLQAGNLSSNSNGVDNADGSGDLSSVFENKSPKTLKKSDSSDSSKTSTSPSNNDKPVIKVNRSNSFTWSSDEEVNIMMSKLRQLIKNLIKSKAEAGSTQSTESQASTSETGVSKDKQLVYLENELIRLMKTDNLKNIVEYLSSEESDVDDVYKFIKVVNSSGSTPVDLSDLGDLGDLDIDDPNLLENLQSTMQLQGEGGGATPGSPKSSPALLAKVMHHIGNRLNMWMKDEANLEDDNNDDNVTIKCAPSVSSDLNEDRFSWKGSFESALAAKRQSVGSTDSISSSDYGPDKSMLRSSSLHHLTTSQPIEENREEEEPSSSLPRMTTLCNSLPRLNQPANAAISRAHSLVMTAKSEQPGTETYPISISGPVKSARYRPPGFQPSMKAKRIDTEEKASPAILSQSTPVLTQDPAMLKNRSDSMGSIFHDVKPLISVKGQVEFGLQYNYKLACLEVKVVGCRDVAAADSKRNRSDPYVKAYLLPDKSKAGKRKTKTKKNTLSPVFDEILKFPLTLSDLQNRTLWLSVWHSDMFGKNEFLGEVLVNLKDRVFDDPNPGWWDLQEMSGQMEDMPKGDVVIALKWQPKTDSTGNLSVLVKEAKNLVPVKNGSPSTFVKCALLSDKTRKQKTSICRRNFNPIWNQTLLFEDVDDDGVEITIWNHDLLASHDLIGTVRLEYDNPLWDSMISRPSFWVEGGHKLS